MTWRSYIHVQYINTRRGEEGEGYVCRPRAGNSASRVKDNILFLGGVDIVYTTNTRFKIIYIYARSMVRQNLFDRERKISNSN